MKTFGDYILDWWYDYMQDADEDTCKQLMEHLIGEEESIEDYIPKDADSPYEWLMDNMTDVNEIYSKFFGMERDGLCPDDMPDTEEFVYQMLKDNASWWDGDTCTLPSFAEEYLRDMANHIEGYDNPLGFFQDLQYGGCQSGMIGMLIYNSDCRRIYIEHIDDMEEYVEQIYEELGFVKNESGVHHYTHICWLCYEEFSYRIGQELFPDTL